MVLQAKVGAFNTTTAAAGNTVVVSDVGFTPKALLFWHSGRTEAVDTEGRLTHKRGVGCAVSTSDRRYCTSLAQDTPTSMVTNCMQGNAACFGITTTGDAIDGLMDLQSFDAGAGFTLVIDDAFTASYRVHYLALGGADITNVVSGSFTKQDGTGNQNITGLTFQPDVVILFSSGQTSNNNTVATDATFTFGIGVNAAMQGLFAGGSNDGAGNSQTQSYCNDLECLAFYNATITGPDRRASFVSCNPDGFTVDWLENVAGATIIQYLAIKGGEYQVGASLTQTGTVTLIPTIRTSSLPRALLVVSHCKTESTQDTSQDDDEWSMGAGTGTAERGSQGVVDNDAAGTAVVSAAVEHAAIYVNMLDTSGAQEGLMDISAVNANGIDLIMDDGDPAQEFFFYLIIADAVFPLAPGTVRKQRLSPLYRM